MSDNNSPKRLGFAAIDPYLESNIVMPTESKASGKEYMLWGEGNDYPNYIKGLGESVTTLRSVINGAVDYCTGNDVSFSLPFRKDGYANRKRDTAMDIMRKIAWNYYTYGGYALQIIRSLSGDILEIYAVNLENLRTDKENECFYYSEEWSKGYGKVNVVKYPKFVKGFNDPASILFYKGTSSGAYPMPLYAAAVKACEIERSVDEFHLNEINNGFMGSYVINFNNGCPSDEMREEIERDINQKFAGKSNAGRMLLAFNDTKENAVTLQKMEIADYGEKYETLANHCRQQIFTAFRCNGNLFGIPTASGFSNEEYEQAFALFNRTMIMPIQRAICDSFDKILGAHGSLNIIPFSLDGNIIKVN